MRRCKRILTLLIAVTFVTAAVPCTASAAQAVNVALAEVPSTECEEQ